MSSNLTIWKLEDSFGNFTNAGTLQTISSRTIFNGYDRLHADVADHRQRFG